MLSSRRNNEGVCVRQRVLRSQQVQQFVYCSIRQVLGNNQPLQYR